MYKSCDFEQKLKLCSLTARSHMQGEFITKACSSPTLFAEVIDTKRLFEEETISVLYPAWAQKEKPKGLFHNM